MNIKEIRQFTTDTFFIGVLRLILRFRGIITIPLLINAYGIKGYGLYVQIGIIMNMLTYLFSLRLPASSIRFLSSKINRKSELSHGFGSLITLSLIFNSIGFFIIFIFFLLKKDFLSLLAFGETRYSSFILLIIFWTISSVLYELSNAFLRTLNKIKLFSLINLLSTLTGILIVVIFSLIKSPLEVLIVLLVINSFLFYIVNMFLITKMIGLPKPNLLHAKRFLSFSIPLIPLSLLRWVINSTDRICITHFLGLSENGIYSVCYAIGDLISIYSYSIFFVLFPTISRHWDHGNYDTVRKYLLYSSSILLFLSVPSSIILFSLSDNILKVISIKEVTEGSFLVGLISSRAMLAGLFQINLYMIYLLNKTVMTTWIFCVGAIINLLFNLFLIPFIGIKGAAVSSIVAYGTLYSITLAFTKKIIGHFTIEPIFLMKLLLAGSLMLIHIKIFIMSKITNVVVSSLLGLVFFLFNVRMLNLFNKQQIAIFKNIILIK